MTRSDRNEAIRTAVAFLCLILCLSLMGWSCVSPEERPPTIDKEGIKLQLQEKVKEMAEDTERFNAEMERRVAELSLKK